MDQIFLIALLAALNPTLLAASTLMLVMPHPRRLMLGYLCGAMLTSVTIGTLLVFSFDSSSTASTARNSVSPGLNFALGLLALVLAWVLASGHHRHVTERRSKKDKGPPRWQQALGRGSARVTFVVGALLTLPGASYLVGLHRIHELDTSDAGKFAVILLFNVVMLILLEGPLLAFTFAPEWTPRAIERAKDWGARRGRVVAVRALVVIGVLLLLRGVLELL